MKTMPQGAKCGTCGGRLHLHHCYECKRWYCWGCEPQDFCIECRLRQAAESEAGIKRIPEHHYS